MRKQFQVHKQIKFLMKFSLFQALAVGLCLNMAHAVELSGIKNLNRTTTNVFLPNELKASAIIVTGKITDNETGEPVPGVNILVKGTTTGTSTDVDGNYSISVPDENSVLIISFIGYTSEEVPVGSQTQINVSLTPDIVTLTDVVVVGYGLQKKEDVIGSIAIVNTKDLNMSAIPNFDAGLQGLAAGVSVQSQGGEPGAATKILVRGTNSINSSTDPLYVLDGMPIFNDTRGLGSGSVNQANMNPMALINPSDIESINVLKDAAATSIYGSRGSNGVILITTKKGVKGQANTNFNFSTGISELTRTPRDVGYANTTEWFKIQDQATRTLTKAGKDDPGRDFQISDYYAYSSSASPGLSRDQALATNTDWLKKMTRTGTFSNYSLSTSQGFEKGSFYVSGNYRKDNNVQKNNDFERFSVRSNFELNPSKNFTIGTRLTFAYTNTNKTPDGLATINASALPWFPVRIGDQYFNELIGQNPVANLSKDNSYLNVKQYRGLGAISVKYEVPFIKGLDLRTELATDIIQSNTVKWRNKNINLNPNTSTAQEEAVTFTAVNYNAYANFERTNGQNHFTATGGVEATRSSQYWRYVSASNIVGEFKEVGSPDPKNYSQGFSGLAQERYLLGYFARAEYKLKDRYLFGVSGRRDGSTAFTKANRWGNFYAAQAGWIITEEDFMSFLTGTFLKLRGSYGETGNQNIPNGLDKSNFYDLLPYGGGSGGTLPSNIPVDNLKWESTKSADVGIDFGFLNNRINGSVAYYHRLVHNILLQAPLAASTGLQSNKKDFPPTGTGQSLFANLVEDRNSNSLYSNIGNMVNSGFELDLHSVNADKNGFKWTTDFNISFNQNHIKNLTAEADKNGRGIVGTTTVSRTGDKRREWFIGDWAGVDTKTGVGMIYKVDSLKYSLTGETERQKDADGKDVLIEATKTNTDKNRFRQKGKSADPTYYGGITNTLKYKSFDFSFLIAFSGGNYILDYDRTRASVPYQNVNLLRDLDGNSWKKPGDVKKYPQLKANDATYGAANNFYNRELYKGDFVRLRNIQFGYTLSKSMIQKVRMQSVRVYISASNLFTRTKYPGYDPEGAGVVNPNSDGGGGLVYFSNALPQLRSFNFGIDAKF